MNFYRTTTQAGRHIGVIHIGIGLLGTAIKHSLLKAFCPIGVSYESGTLTWNKTPDISAAFLFTQWKDQLSDLSELTFIWSAGKAGFHASTEETARELAHFTRILCAIKDLVRQCRFSTSFIFISSAGGLFEGQTHVDVNSRPSPRRPYGVLKQRQEEVLAQCSTFNNIMILRVSSAYSLCPTASETQRKGLFRVMLENGLRNRVCRLHGTDDTIRDYVATEDVATWITSHVIRGMRGCIVTFLVSSKPCTIFEIRIAIERLLRRRIYISYVADQNNSDDISFCESVRARCFVPKSYTEGLATIYHGLNR